VRNSAAGRKTGPLVQHGWVEASGLLVALGDGTALVHRQHISQHAAAGQAVAILEMAKVVSGHTRFVFPSIRSPKAPMTENTVNAALRRLGFTGDEMTAHGFRAMASTLLNESGKWSPDAIERALAHKDKDIVRAAYHRGAHWQERVDMAQWWADYLDVLRDGADVIPMRAAS
jgi:integrase